MQNDQDAEVSAIETIWESGVLRAALEIAIQQSITGKPVDEGFLFNIWDKTVLLIFQELYKSQEVTDNWKQMPPEEKLKRLEGVAINFHSFVAGAYEYFKNSEPLSENKEGLETQADKEKSNLCTEEIDKKITFHVADDKIEKIIKSKTHLK